MTRNLVINADDFGFSAGVTDGIVQAHTSGILTSTTLMTTMPDARRAVDTAKHLPNLGVGIHLCLTQGTPLAGLEGPLLAYRGDFPQRVPQLIWRIFRDKSVLRHVHREWEAQINTAISWGLVPTHLDPHKHVHHWPPLGDIAIDLARQFNIRHIRCAREIAVRGTPAPGMGYKILANLAKKLAGKIELAGSGTSDWFFGLGATGKFSSEVWKKLLENIPEHGTGEVMVHPGRANGLSTGQTRLVAERQLELDALCNPEVKGLLSQSGIRLIHYGQLSAEKNR